MYTYMTIGCFTSLFARRALPIVVVVAGLIAAGMDRVDAGPAAKESMPAKLETRPATRPRLQVAYSSENDCVRLSGGQLHDILGFAGETAPKQDVWFIFVIWNF